MALGASSNVTGAQGVGVGIYTQVNTSQSAAIGYGSVTSSGRPNVVSVGSGGVTSVDSNNSPNPISTPATRIIENVTNGQYSQDAATVNQLPGQFVTSGGAASSTPTQYYRFGNDATSTAAMSTSSPSVTLQNVAAGTQTTDAANVGQLPGTISYSSGGQGTVNMGNAAAPGGNSSPVDVQNVHNLTASGAIQSQSLSTTGNTSVGGNLAVTGTSTTNGISNTGTISSTGNITSQQTVQGATLTDGTATLTGGNLTTTGSVNAGTVSTTGNASVGGNLSVSGGANFNNQTVTGVKAGTLSATSTDAVNGSQLYTTNQNVSAAQATANTALSAAGAAQTTANAALSAAGAAQTTANTALSTAGAAQTTANQALNLGVQNSQQIQAVNNAVAAVNQLVQANICHIVGSSITCGQQAQVLNGNTLADPNNPHNSVAATAGATAIGDAAKANDVNTTAIGNGASASFAGSVAIGAGAQANADPTTAVGNNAIANGNNSVALGANTTANGSNSVALGQGSVANRANSVSVGNAATGLARQITNVAPGTAGTDAVNVDQLNQAVGSLRSRIDATGAMAAAMSNIQLPPGYRVGFGAAVGHQGGQNAPLALGLVATPAQNVLTRMSASFSQGTTAVGAGVTIGW